MAGGEQRVNIVLDFDETGARHVRLTMFHVRKATKGVMTLGSIQYCVFVAENTRPAADNTYYAILSVDIYIFSA